MGFDSFFGFPVYIRPLIKLNRTGTDAKLGGRRSTAGNRVGPRNGDLPALTL